MATFYEKLLAVHAKIAIKDEDRKPYTEMYDDVRNWLIAEMRAEDPVFNKLFQGTNLFGSYANGVRIIKPNEFDVFISLKFPFPIKASTHPVSGGYIEIGANQLINVNDYEIRNKLQSMLNAAGKLDRGKFQGWIESIITTVLNKKRLNGYAIKHELLDVSQQIKVTKVGCPDKRISFDLVPSIILSEENVKPLVNVKRTDYLKSFVAIPKRLIERGQRHKTSTSFQLVNPDAERDIMWDKQNLKIVYRLLKSLRNKKKLHRIKSYFLTTIFLLEVDKQRPEFWQKPVDIIFFHMLAALVEYFRQGFLPFYWIPRLNLLSNLKAEIETYHKALSTAYWDLKRLADANLSLKGDDVSSHFQTD